MRRAVGSGSERVDQRYGYSVNKGRDAPRLMEPWNMLVFGRETDMRL